MRIQVEHMSESQLQAFAPGATIELPNFGSVTFKVIELGPDWMIVEPTDFPSPDPYFSDQAAEDRANFEAGLP